MRNVRVAVVSVEVGVSSECFDRASVVVERWDVSRVTYAGLMSWWALWDGAVVWVGGASEDHVVSVLVEPMSGVAIGLVTDWGSVSAE